MSILETKENLYSLDKSLASLLDVQLRSTLSVTLTGVADGAGGSGAKSKYPIGTPTILKLIEFYFLASFYSPSSLVRFRCRRRCRYRCPSYNLCAYFFRRFFLFFSFNLYRRPFHPVNCFGVCVCMDRRKKFQVLWLDSSSEKGSIQLFFSNFNFSFFIRFLRVFFLSLLFLFQQIVNVLVRPKARLCK